MAKVQNKEDSGVPKMNFDYEELKSKYDCILPQVFEAVEHVKDSGVRESLVCLFTDIYRAFLQPELEKETNEHPSQLINLIMKCIEETSNIKKEDFLEAKKQTGTTMAKSSNLDRAKALQEQIKNIDGYLDNLLESLPAAKQKDGDMTETLKNTDCSFSISFIPETLGLATLNKTEHCTATSITTCSKQGNDLSSPGRDFSLSMSAGVGGSCRCTTLGNQDTFTSHVVPHSQNITDNERLRLKEEEGPIPLKQVPGCTRKRHQSNRSPSWQTRKSKLVLKGIPDFQRKLPPRYMRNSSLFRVKSKRCPCLHPCREVIYSSGDQYSAEVRMSENTNNANHPDGCYSTHRESVVEYGYEFSSESQEGDRPTISKSRKRSFSSTLSSSRKVGPEIPCIIEKVETIGRSLQDRKTRIGALIKRNYYLNKQIREVENTLKSFDNYLNRVKSKPYSPSFEVVKSDVCAFQGSMINTIFSCIETLSDEMKALRKIDQTKTTRVQALLTKYGITKKATPEALLIFEGMRDESSLFHHCAGASLTSNDLKQSIEAVVLAIDCFHTSCEDIWDETLTRAFSELDTMFNSMSSPPVKRWSPDDPCMPAWVSLHSLDVLEDDLCTITRMVEDKTKYGALIVLSLRFLERLTNEFDRMMVLSRIKDLQMISIDHCIGLAYMSIRQMVLPLTKILSPQDRGICNKKKSMNPNAETKPKAKKSRQAKPTLPEKKLAEVNSENKRKLVNTGFSKREERAHGKQQDYKGGDTDVFLNNEIGTSKHSETKSVEHMASAAGMMLAFFHTDSYAQAACTDVTALSSDLGPWSQQTNRKNSQRKILTKSPKVLIEKTKK